MNVRPTLGAAFAITPHRLPDADGCDTRSKATVCADRFGIAVRPASVQASE
jgi:hypothetical protein